MKVRPCPTELQVYLRLCCSLKWRSHIHPCFSILRFKENTQTTILRQSSKVHEYLILCAQFLHCNHLFTCHYAYKTLNSWKGGATSFLSSTHSFWNIIGIKLINDCHIKEYFRCFLLASNLHELQLLSKINHLISLTCFLTNSCDLTTIVTSMTLRSP